MAEQEKEAGAQAWQSGNYDLAVVHWTKAIDIGGNKEFLKTLYSNRSAAYLKLKQTTAALVDAEKCCQLDSTWVKGITRKGDALYAMGKFTESYNAYNSGLRLQPNDKTLMDKSEQVMKAMRSSSTSQNSAGWDNTGTSASTPTANAPGIAGMVQTYGRLLVFACTLAYLLPLGRISFASYKAFAVCSAAVNLVSLFSKHGMPKFNMAYASQVLPDPHAMGVFLALLLLGSRPYLLAMTPVLLAELTHYTPLISKYCLTNLPAIESQVVPLIARFAPQLAAASPVALLTELLSPRSLHKLNTQLTRTAAMAEISQGIFLIVELILPTRNLMFLALWWQYLQMRYMLDQSGNVKAAFSSVDSQITSLLSNRMCPPIVMRGYCTVKSYLAKQVEQPTAGGGAAPGGLAGGLSSMMSKCSIM